MKRIVTILSAALVLAGSLQAQELTNFSFGGPAPVISPEIQGDSVTFRLKADYATVVKLSGSWMPNPWGDTIDMTRGAGNVWSVKIPLPPAEIYTYNFVVDGVAVNDPQNVYVQRDGTRYLPMFTVPGERTENYGEATKHGTVSHPWYDSKVLGFSRRLTVYTPYGYEANPKKKYPVLYLLHGAGGDEEAWISMGRTAQILDNLIEKGLAEPMIVVMPNGNPGQQAARTLGIPEKQLDWRAPEFQNIYVKSLCEEIVPFIEKNFRVIANPDNRAIAGLSMGGGNTYTCSTMYPDMFRYIAPFSAAIFGDMDKVKLQAIKDAGCKLYFIACGSADSLITTSDNLDKALTEIGLKHTYMVTEGGHTWANWRLYLNTLAPLLFK